MSLGHPYNYIGVGPGYLGGFPLTGPEATASSGDYTGDGYEISGNLSGGLPSNANIRVGAVSQDLIGGYPARVTPSGPMGARVCGACVGGMEIQAGGPVRIQPPLGSWMSRRWWQFWK